MKNFNACAMGFECCEQGLIQIQGMLFIELLGFHNTCGIDEG